MHVLDQNRSLLSRILVALLSVTVWIVWFGPYAVAVKPIKGGQIIARVGGEVILAGEVLGNINRFLKQNVGSIPPEETDKLRSELMQRQLTNRPRADALNLIEVKILYGEVRKAAPAENLGKIRGRISENFDTTILPSLMEATNSASRGALDDNMREYGSSIEQQRQSFIERQIARSWIGERINRDPEITHVQMLAYYQEHLADYEHPAKAKWEELMVRFDRFDGDKDAAYQALAAMGNDAWHFAHGQGGQSWGEIAKAKSHGYTAADGGKQDWTTKGSLVAGNIDAALFRLPIGELSEILEGPNGWHILRVTERQDAGRTPFADAQSEIRQHLRDEAITASIDAYLGKLRRRTRVWTIFSGEMTAEALIASSDQPMQR